MSGLVSSRPVLIIWRWTTGPVYGNSCAGYIIGSDYCVAYVGGDGCWHTSMAWDQSNKLPKTKLEAAWEVCQGHYNGTKYDDGFESLCRAVAFQYKNRGDLKIIEDGLNDKDGVFK